METRYKKITPFQYVLMEPNSEPLGLYITEEAPWRFLRLFELVMAGGVVVAENLVYESELYCRTDEDAQDILKNVLKMWQSTEFRAQHPYHLILEYGGKVRGQSLPVLPLPSFTDLH